MFKNKYVQKKEHGREYFEGDCKDMIKDIEKICLHEWNDYDNNGDNSDYDYDSSDHDNDSDYDDGVIYTYEKLRERENSNIECIILTSKRTLSGYVKYRDNNPGYPFGKKSEISLPEIIRHSIKTECYDLEKIISDICLKTYNKAPEIYSLQQDEYPVFNKGICYILNFPSWELTPSPRAYFPIPYTPWWPTYYGVCEIDMDKIINALVINPHFINNYQLLCRNIFLEKKGHVTHFVDYYSGIPYFSRWLENAVGKLQNDKFKIESKSSDKLVIRAQNTNQIICTLVSDNTPLTKKEKESNTITRIKDSQQSPYNLKAYDDILAFFGIRNDGDLFQSCSRYFWDYIKFVVK